MGNITDLYGQYPAKQDHKADWKEDAKKDWKVDWTAIAPPPPTPAPVSAFSADVTSGAAPLSVAFTSMSTGSITTYAWDFGDMGTSNLQNPAYIYSTPGVYTVSLTVTGPGGSDVDAQTGYITVS
jgi:PKD repeat protein